ncbi:4-coumarate--CoA ligase [Coemansia sp. RSA 2320]|nr:4-coumarate--CoA ligase [Coemansia sp. RSA 2320]
MDEPVLMVDGVTGHGLSFSDIRKQSLAVARGLSDRGFTSKCEDYQTAVVFAPVSIYFSVIHFGTLMAGGVYAAFDPDLSHATLAKRLMEVNAAAVFTSAELLPTLLAACESAKLTLEPSNIILISGNCSGYETLSSLCKKSSQDSSFEPYVIRYLDEQERKVANIVYTSGTTGDGKGVMLTHRNLIAAHKILGGNFFNSYTNARELAAERQKRRYMLSALPLWFHYGHCVLCYQPLISGDCIVQLPSFNLPEYMDTLERYHVERIFSTPRLLHSLLTGTAKSDERTAAIGGSPARSYDIGSVKAIVCGGATLPDCHRRRASAYFGGATITIGYGQSETCGVIAGCVLKKPAPGAVGVLYPGLTAKVVDEHGQETTAFGDLCIAGPTVMKGYAGRSEPPVDKDGFLHTGDYARVDAGGSVFLSGRMTDIIPTTHGPVSPTGIEDILFEHPSVEDCAVVGQMLNGLEQPVAFVVLAADARSVPGCMDGIEVWLREKAGLEVVCREISGIPKSPAGKVLRNMFKQA